ncbi:hypothetical protein ACU4GD_17810 [Cupriavidus basilensis]
MGYARLGFNLLRATLCEWKLGSAELLETLLPSLRTRILQAGRTLELRQIQAVIEDTGKGRHSAHRILMSQ